MNFVFNSPTMPFMRQLKDSLTRDEYNNISTQTIENKRNRQAGIGKTVIEIAKFVKENNYPILSLNDIYQKIVNQ